MKLSSEPNFNFIVNTLVGLTKYDPGKVIKMLENDITPESIIESCKTPEEALKNAIPDANTKSDIVPVRLQEKELEKIAPKTGYPKLDDLIKGFIPGHLYAFTGSTNIGKTAIAANFSINVAKQGKKVLYLALEPDNTILDYLASIVCVKKFDDVVEKDYESIPDNITYFGKDKVDTPEKLLDIIREHDRYDLIIIDHIGYFITDTRNPYQTQANVIKQLVGMAKEKKCAIMMIAHLRKSGASKKKKDDMPSMDDISGSAAFKQDSTEVLIAIRTEDDSDEFRLNYLNEGYILVHKTKSGRPGAVKIQFYDGGAGVTEKQDEFRPF